MGDDFKILIMGDASSLVAASQQTNAALESNKLKLSELTPEQKANTAAMVKGGDAAQDAAKQVKGAGEEAHKAGISHMEFRAAAHGLSEQFPILGNLARLAIHPIGIVVAAAASAFAIF